MAVKAFKFASPGIFLNEIDQSQVAQQPGPVGPIIIGRAQRGPAMRPVTVASYDEFVQTFGDPIAGGESSGDVWRSGVPSGPTYGPYAAQAWLANNPTVTYVRLLGVQSDSANTNETSSNAGLAGWTVKEPGNAVPTGAYGLFLFPSASGASETTITGTLAAVWYCTNAVPILSGTLYLSGTLTTTASNGIFFTSTDGNFTVQMNGGATPGIDGSSKKTFNFSPTSDKFIRKVFNTNPQNTNTGSPAGMSTSNASYYGYWLGETFENDIDSNLYVTGTAYTLASGSGGPYAGIILPLKEYGSSRLGKQASNDYAARTGWIISQGPAGQVSNFDAISQTTRLFRFVAIDGGDWIRNNLKITINNITPPQNDAQKYGTFDVEVRKINDTDANKKLVESFTGCSLDPSSPNYIVNKIGDYYYEWNDSTKTLSQAGKVPNKSNFIRVDMAPAAKDDPYALPASALPFGILGPIKPRDTENALSSTTTSNLFYSTSSCYGAFLNKINFTASVPLTPQTFKFTLPNIRVRSSSYEDSLTTFRIADWGATTTRNASSILYNDGINDLLRLPVTGVTSGEFTSGILNSAGGMQYSWVFSLDEVKISGSSYTNNNWVNPYFIWTSGSKKSTGTAGSYTAVSGTFADLLNLGINSFTTLFQGGIDGFNIVEREPLRNTAIAAGASSDTNYVYNTYRRAIDTVRDPEFVEGNLLVIPGLVQENLTQYVTQIAEQRGDILAVIDPSGETTNRASYVTPYEYSSDYYTGNRSVSVDSVITQIKSRNLNSSYGAAYYPWVQISDSNTGQIVTIPPSVVAVGAMSYTDKIQAPWFAPAGFNRGGLSTGNAGVNVVNVVKKLTSSERDKLYPVNINPIASFPNEGIVIFGQKTLQATPSALDRINVRRLMLYIKRGINLISSQILFEPNIEATWNNFKDKAEPFLSDVKARFGLTDYRLILDETTTTPDLIDQNIMYAKIYLKPARAIEFIAIDFFITKTGAQFPV